MFQKVNVPVLGIVENMASFSCPNCHHISHLFGHGGARREAERLGVPFLAELPLDIEIRERSDAGRPIVATASHSDSAAIYRSIAADIRSALEEGVSTRRPPPRIVIE